MSHDAAYILHFYDTEGERMFGGRVWDVRLTNHHEVVPVDDYFEVWFDPLYNWRCKDAFGEVFFERAEVTGIDQTRTWMAAPTSEFGTFEVEPVFPGDARPIDRKEETGDDQQT